MSIEFGGSNIYKVDLGWITIVTRLLHSIVFIDVCLFLFLTIVLEYGQ